MDIVPHEINPDVTCVVLFEVTGYSPNTTYSPVYNAYRVIDGSPALWETVTITNPLVIGADGTGSWGANVINNQHDPFGNVIMSEFILGPLSWGPEHVTCGTPSTPTPSPTPVPKTQSLVIESTTNPGACLLRASVAGYEPDSRIPMVKANWRWQTDHWEEVNVSTTYIVVGSDGTGSVTLIVSNDTGRDDLRTDLYIDGVVFIDFTQVTC